MVFNPSLQGGIQFQQPVSQPAGGEVLNTLVQGLFGGSGSQERQPTVGEAFDNAVRQHSETRGIGGIGSWSPQDASLFAQEYPQYADDLDQALEVVGNTALLEIQEANQGFIDWQQTPAGQVALVEAHQRFPDNEGSREAFMLQQRAAEAQRVVAHERLIQDRDTGAAVADLAQQAWDVEELYIRSDVANFSFDLAQIAPALMRGETVDLRQVAPELAEQLGVNIVTADTIGDIVPLLQQNYINGQTASLREEYGRDFPLPDQEYIDDVFQELTNLVEDIQDRTNPATILERYRAGQEYELRRWFDEQGVPLALVDLAQGNDLMSSILQNTQITERFHDAITQITTGNTVSPDTIEGMGADEVEDFTDLTLGLLDMAASGRRDLTPREQRQINSFIQGLGQIHSESGNVFSDEVYQQLLSANTVRLLNDGAFGDEASQAVSQMLMHDIQLRVDYLRQQAGVGVNGDTAANFQLVFENGQVRAITPRVGLGDTGETLWENYRELTRNQQEALDDMNNLLSMLDTSAARDLFNADIVSVLEADLTVEGPGETVGGPQEVPASTPAPSFQSRRGAQPIIDSLISTEARGGSPAAWDSRNNEAASPGTVGGQQLSSGHFGRLQFSPARLEDAVRAGVMAAGVTVEEFLASPRIQMAVEAWHVQDIMSNLQRDGLLDRVGETINGIPITQGGLVAAAHLGGYQGMLDFVNSGGASNPNDVYGTSLMNYFTRHGGAEELRTDPSTWSVPSNASPLEGYENVYTNSAMSPIFTMEGASQMTQPYAAENMDRLLRGPFQELQSMFGAPLIINDAIARSGTSRENETPGSQHFHGNAIDIDISQMSTEDHLRLVRTAIAAGFTGFGLGNGILHIDVGPTRSWAYGNTNFGGVPVSEVQEWIASGAGSPLGNYAGGDLPPDVSNLQEWMAGAAEVEYDPVEGAPTNYQLAQPLASVEQPEEASPEAAQNGPTQQGTGEQAGQNIPQASAEIQAMIDAFTSRGGDVEELRAFLEQFNITDPQGRN